jgi:uncharacterized DUF497 family protein
MLDLTRIVGFNWDYGNVRKSLLKHDVSQLEAEQVFLDPRLLFLEDIKHSRLEKRYQALGKALDGNRLHVTFTLREDGTRIRVISARPMNRKEKALYEQEA